MKVCDMCLKELNPLEEKNVVFDEGRIIEKRYSLCPKCCDKLKKFINFERSRKGGASAK